MDAYRAVVDKRDGREFDDRPVPEPTLQRVLQAARMAGSGKNRQAGRIVVVSAAHDRARVAACADYGAWLVEAPVVLVFGIHEDGGHHPDFDIGRMAQNAMVVCHAEGLASCPVTVARQNDLREALGIPPTYHVPVMVGLGYGSASDGTRGSHPRRPLSEIVHMGSWQDDGEWPTG